jgi:hypothetical protein
MTGRVAGKVAFITGAARSGSASTESGIFPADRMEPELTALLVRVAGSADQFR